MGAEDPGPGAEHGAGLIDSLRNLASTLVEAVRTRLALLATEIEEERVRLSRLWVLLMVASVFLTLGMFTLTLFIAVLFWDTQRLLVIGLLAALYLAIGGGVAIAARNMAQGRPKLFSASLDELAKDRDQLKSE